VVFQHRIVRQTPIALGLVALLLFVPGCPLSPDSDEGGGGNENRLPERTTVDSTVDYYAFVWENRLYNEYSDVLHPNYEFYPLDEDAQDFPWLTGDSWGRTEELRMAANLFNPEFEPPDGSEARRVDRITMELTNRVQRNLLQPPGAVEVTTDVDAFVWFNENDALRTTGRFVFELVQGGDGNWLILRQYERELL
jgi:hypothetical protein